MYAYACILTYAYFVNSQLIRHSLLNISTDIHGGIAIFIAKSFEVVSTSCMMLLY